MRITAKKKSFEVTDVRFRQVRKWQRELTKEKLKHGGLEFLRTWGTNLVAITKEEAKIGKEKIEKCGKRLECFKLIFQNWWQFQMMTAGADML